jgi:hypothetical protein
MGHGAFFGWLEAGKFQFLDRFPDPNEPPILLTRAE